MKLFLTAALVMALSVGLTACGDTKRDRALSGAGIGAGVGAATAAATGGSVGGGALIGAGIGAATGAATDRDDLDLGDAAWN